MLNLHRSLILTTTGWREEELVRAPPPPPPCPITPEVSYQTCITCFIDRYDMPHMCATTIRK